MSSPTADPSRLVSGIPQPEVSRVPQPEPALPLSRSPLGWRRVVIHVDGPDRAELEREGLLPGSMVVVTARTPLGGPLVVEVGRARLALSSRVADHVATRAFTPLDGLLP